jgi:hypothetical protein
MLMVYFAFKERQRHFLTNRRRYNFSVQALAVTIKMITVNFPLATPNVTEKETRKDKNFPYTFLTYRKAEYNRDCTGNSPIKPTAGRKEQKQDGHHC